MVVSHWYSSPRSFHANVMGQISTHEHKHRSKRASRGATGVKPSTLKSDMLFSDPTTS